jgi:hypothetical protein
MTLVVGFVFGLCAAVDGDLTSARSAARCPAESGAAGRCAGPVENGCQRDRPTRRRRRRVLIP